MYAHDTTNIIITMKTVKNTRSIKVETLKALQAIAEHVAENEHYKLEWVETVKDEGFEYGKNSLYYLAKKSLTFSDSLNFEAKMLKELISELTA